MFLYSFAYHRLFWGLSNIANCIRRERIQYLPSELSEVFDQNNEPESLHDECANQRFMGERTLQSLLDYEEFGVDLDQFGSYHVVDLE